MILEGDVEGEGARGGDVDNREGDLISLCGDETGELSGVSSVSEELRDCLARFLDFFVDSLPFVADCSVFRLRGGGGGGFFDNDSSFFTVLALVIICFGGGGRGTVGVVGGGSENVGGAGDGIVLDPLSSKVASEVVVVVDVVDVVLEYFMLGGGDEENENFLFLGGGESDGASGIEEVDIVNLEAVFGNLELIGIHVTPFLLHFEY